MHELSRCSMYSKRCSLEIKEQEHTISQLLIDLMSLDLRFLT